ncbi:MAG: hypothetical protein SGI99_00780, partial [Pseudomonadota bacterium]|nr:hypothetical protein [Pseudomonadota bacterium]
NDKCLYESMLQSSTIRQGVALQICGRRTPAAVTASSDRWNLPRYMFNHDWKSVEELLAILHS